MKSFRNTIVFLAFSALIFAFCISVDAATINKPTNNLGMIVYWTFDGADMAPNVRDRSGNGNHANLGSGFTSTTTRPGVVGQALAFEPAMNCSVFGTSDFIGTSAVTMTMWIYWEDTASSRFILSNGKTQLTTLDANRLRHTSDGVTAITTASQSLTLNAWNFVAVTRDASGNSEIFVNGVSKGSGSSGTPALGTYNVRLSANDVGGNNIQSDLDEVRIYTRVLSASEINALYNSGLGKTSVAKSPGTLSNGLVGHWTFDGPDMASGIRDKSGKGYTGHLINAAATTTLLVPGKLGQALLFDGSNDRATFGNITEVDAATTMSVSLWVKTNSERLQMFAGKFPSGASGWDLQTSSPPNSRQVAMVFYPSNVNVATPAALNTGQWQHIVMVYDGSRSTNAEKIQIYVDGVAQTLSFSGTVPSAISSNSTAFTLGGWSGGSSTLHGAIDEARLYNRVLNTSEIQQLYAMGGGGKVNTTQTKSNNGLASGLIGHWTFDGPRMTPNVIDSSGQGNHGNLSGQISTTTGPGKIGQALKFDGIDDHIDAESDFILTNPVTISAWIYPKSFGSGNTGRILSNGRTEFNINSSSARLNFTGNGGTNIANSAVSSVVLNQWSFVAVTRNSSGVANIYINGVLSGTADQDSGTPVNGSSNVGIGVRLASSSSFFDGMIDDVRAYNRVLTAAEILQIYNTGK